MIYKIRLILDTKEDVVRDIAIDFNDSLEDLHNAITNAFGFDGTEMAAFYLTDDDWNQGEEMEANISMQGFILRDILTEDKGKLLYVYDFFSMWTFYVELISAEEKTPQVELPSILLSVGVVPSEAPDKEFISEDSSNGDDDDDFDTLENFDDFDFDNFDELMN